MKQASFETRRIGALSDGVFGIAMTLLVLDLKLPDVGKDLPTEIFWITLADQLPPDVDGFRSLEAIGAFGALHHRWTKRWQSDFYYGYLHVESTPLTAGDAVQNGGINLIWSPRPGFGIGVEYDYGERQVREGTSSENHRVQFAIQFGP